MKVMVSGRGAGRLVVGDAVVPLVAPPQMRSGAVTNTLLLAVGRGVRKEVWFDKPDGLDVALDSDDFLIGEMPTWYWAHGWLAFPHTDATVPCIHDLYVQTLEFCPKDVSDPAGEPDDYGDDPYYECDCAWSGNCNCCTGARCRPIW